MMLSDTAATPFRLGVDYWPARTGLYGWERFDKAVVADDFARIREAGLDLVRVFLLWEFFQPRPRKVAPPALDRLVAVAEQADRRGLGLVTTLFTGHASGLNWLPPWTLLAREGEPRHLTYCLGRTRRNLPRNFYEETELLEAQVLLVREVAGALQGHPALRAWDLGNTPSRIVRPPDREAGRLWIRVMCEELKSRDASVPVTLGLHEEDLREGDGLRPGDHADLLDFLSIEGAPWRSEVAEGTADPAYPPFVAVLTRWLGNGREVLVHGLAAPTLPEGAGPASDPAVASQTAGIPEEEAARFVETTLARLREVGVAGVLLSRFSDFDPLLWTYPPLDTHPEERHQGIYRADGSPKPLQSVLREFSPRDRETPAEFPPSWIDISRQEYEEAPEGHFERLYRNCREGYG